MNAFQRSWHITKLSLDVINKDKELFLFPILSGIFSVAFMIAMVLPYFFTAFWSSFSNLGTLGYFIIMFLIYLGLAFIATFFNVCTVYTIKKRFEGGNASFGESIKFSISRFNRIFSWSLLAAVVGLLLRLLEGRDSNGNKNIIASIIASVLGLAWSLMTIFVVPSMVYKDLGPIDAIKNSVNTLKKTWGESLIRAIGTGFVYGTFVVLGIVVFLGLLILTLSINLYLTIAIALIGVIYFIGLVTMFNLINAVFNTALYAFADSGKVPAFDEQTLKGAFNKK